MNRRRFVRATVGTVMLWLPRSARAAITDDLVSYWDLTETSGTRVDSHGSNDLTDNNTVGYSAEAWGNAADFELDNSEYLSKDSGYSAGLGPTAGDFSFSTWFKPESQPGAGGVNGLACVGINWALGYVNESGYKLWLQRYTGSWENRYVAQTLSNGTVYHIVLNWDYSAHSVEFFVNGSSIGSDSSGSTTPAVTWNDPFRLGSTQYSPGDGVFGPTGFWQRRLTGGEIDTLYNGGTPVLYAGLTASPTRKRVPLVW